MEVNGKKVETARELTRLVAEIGVGDTAEVKAIREDAESVAKRLLTREWWDNTDSVTNLLQLRL